jgi:hypothetical protein
MKTRILALSVSAAIALTSVTPLATFASEPTVSILSGQNPTFTSLRTHKQAKGITAIWSMTGLDGVVSFTIQRTYEDPTDMYAYWENLCDLPCNSSRSFTYTDKEVFPGNINYRVAALMEDGTFVYSEISSVRIVSRK